MSCNFPFLISTRHFPLRECAFLVISPSRGPSVGLVFYLFRLLFFAFGRGVGFGVCVSFESSTFPFRFSLVSYFRHRRRFAMDARTCGFLSVREASRVSALCTHYRYE